MSDRLFSGASPREVEADLAPLVDFQEEGLHIADMNRMVEENLLKHLMRYDSPSCQGFFNPGLEEGATYGAEVALEWNQGISSWQMSPGGAVLEELCCRALCDLFGFGPEADATLLCSGGHGNLQALFMALQAWANGAGPDHSATGLTGLETGRGPAVLASEDADPSLAQTVRILGLGDDALIPVPVDRNRRMDPDGLGETLERVRAQRDVFCVVATAGTATTGAVDPLKPIAQLCRDQGVWMHVDGSYGLAYRLVPEKSDLFEGLGLADTASWDPQNQMGVPIPSSVLFARDGGSFELMAPPVPPGARSDPPCPDPGSKSILGVRPFSALPLVTSIRHQGLRRLADRLRRPLTAMAGFYAELFAFPDVELLHEPDTGILSFRVRQPSMSEVELERLQEHICRAIGRKGRRAISVIRLGGKPAIRIVAVSPGVTTASLLGTLSEALQIAGAFR